MHARFSFLFLAGKRAGGGGLGMAPHVCLRGGGVPVLFGGTAIHYSTVPYPVCLVFVDEETAMRHTARGLVNLIARGFMYDRRPLLVTGARLVLSGSNSQPSPLQCNTALSSLLVGDATAVRLVVRVDREKLVEEQLAALRQQQVSELPHIPPSPQHNHHTFHHNPVACRHAGPSKLAYLVTPRSPPFQVPEVRALPEPFVQLMFQLMSQLLLNKHNPESCVWLKEELALGGLVQNAKRTLTLAIATQAKSSASTRPPYRWFFDRTKQ